MVQCHNFLLLVLTFDAPGDNSAGASSSSNWSGRQRRTFHGNTGARYRPPINLANGTHGGTVTVSDPNAVNNPRTIAVTLKVGPANR